MNICVKTSVSNAVKLAVKKAGVLRYALVKKLIWGHDLSFGLGQLHVETFQLFLEAAEDLPCLFLLLKCLCISVCGCVCGGCVCVRACVCVYECV